MSNVINENFDVIIICLTILLSLMILKFATKILFRLIIVIIVIIGGFITYQQFSGTNIIDDIQLIYCNKEAVDLVKCECFVQPILLDLENKFSKEEMKSLKAKKLRANTEFIKSYKNKELEIKNCFQKNGTQGNIMDEIIQNIKNKGLEILQ